MKPTTKLKLRRTEIRALLKSFSAGEDLPEGVMFDGLTSELEDIDKRLLASELSEPEPEARPVPDSESRALAKLRSKARVGDYLRAALEGRGLSGASAEYAQHFDTGTDCPLDIFESRAITPAPADSSLQQNLKPIVPAIFDRSIAAYCGIAMPSVRPGVAAWPTLTSGVAPGFVAEDASADATASSISVSTVTPSRLTAQFSIRVEDEVRLSDLETALRRNLSEALTDALDKQLMTGNGTAPNLNGLLEQQTDASDPASANTYATYASRVFAFLDGTYAMGPEGLSLVLGAKTAQHMLTVFNSGDGVSAYMGLKAAGVKLRVSARIPDPASNIQKALVIRSNPKGDTRAVAPVWRSVKFIKDPYTDAAKGHTHVTALMLCGGVLVLRPGCYKETRFKLA